MAINIKKFFATAESRSMVMLASGVLSLLAAVAVAVVIWQRWFDIGVVLRTKAFILVATGSAFVFIVAGTTGIWALTAINKLDGPNAVKFTVGYIMDAVALAVVIAFLMIAVFLRATIAY